METSDWIESLALLNAAMICPHPQPFSRWEKGAISVLSPLPVGEG